jgi:hypothetical protein
MTAPAWHEQWTAATRTLEVAKLDLTTALHELRPDQCGDLRRYRERVDDAQREVDRLLVVMKDAMRPDVRDVHPSQEWPR